MLNLGLAVSTAISLLLWRIPPLILATWMVIGLALVFSRRHSNPLLFIAATLITMAAFGPWLAPYDPAQQILVPGDHLLGLDRTGRDLFSRLLIGNRNSVVIAAGGSLMACLLGLSIGLGMALGPRWLHWSINRLIQAYMIIPILIYYLLGLALFTPGAATLIGLLAVTLGPDLARIVQVRITELRQAPFVQVARMAGMTNRQIIWREIAPNLLRLLTVNFLVCFGNAIVIETVLGYLGLGLGVGTPSLGHLIEYGVRHMDRQPLVLPAALISMLAWIICLRLLARQAEAPEVPPVLA